MEILSRGALRSEDVGFMAHHGLYLTSEEWGAYVSNEYDGDGVIYVKGYYTNEGFVFAADRDRLIEYLINEHGEVIYKDHSGCSLGTHVLNSGIRFFHLFRKLFVLANSSHSAKRFMHFMKKMEKLDKRGFSKVPFDLGVDADSCVTLWEELLLYSYWRYEDSETVYSSEKMPK
jgi:hypothetical protein